MTPRRSLLALLAWTSPSFPVGAFTYSHGLETAVDDGQVSGRDGLRAWIEDLLAHGAARNDAILAAAAWHAAAGARDADLAELNDLALALCPSRERRLEAAAQGSAFSTAIRAAWPEAAAAWPPGELAYPVAFGGACGRAGLDLVASLEAFGLAFVGNLVSAAIRLSVVGQTDGQRTIAALEPAVAAAASRTSSAACSGGPRAASAASAARPRGATSPRA